MSSVFNPAIMGAAASGNQAVTSSPGSLLFDGSTGYLSGGPAEAGDHVDSVWVKRVTTFTDNGSVSQYAISSNPQYGFGFGNTTNSSDTAYLYVASNNVSAGQYRDPTAWMHLLHIKSGGNSSYYINNQLVVGPIANAFAETVVNIGRFYAGSNYFNGYMADIVRVTGAAVGSMSASTFGADDGNGTWVPRSFSAIQASINGSGGYGTNGFHLAPQDGSTILTGATVTDYSGNGNDFTLVGGVTAEADGPSVNMANLNAVSSIAADMNSISDGNLTVNETGNTSTPLPLVAPTLALPESGRYALTVSKISQATIGSILAIIPAETAENATCSGAFPTVTDYLLPNGNVGASVLHATSGATVDAKGTYIPGGPSADLNHGWYFGDTNAAEVFWDADAGNAYIKANGGALVQFGTGMNDGTRWRLQCFERINAANTWSFDFGQSGYTPTEAGYSLLQASSFPAPLVSDPTTIQGALTFTSAGAAINVPVLDSQGNAVNLATDGGLIIVKRTDAAGDWYWIDTVRGANNYWQSNNTNADVTDANLCSAINDGSVDFGTSLVAGTYVLYYFKITAGVFDIVSYTGNGAASRAIAHSIGVKPDLMIGNPNSVGSPVVYHGTLGATQFLYLEQTAAAATDARPWVNTEPTATDFTVGNGGFFWNKVGIQETFYLWANSPGLTHFGRRTGASGFGFVNAGLSPAIHWGKQISVAGDGWFAYDAASNPSNPASVRYRLNQSANPPTGTDVDFTAVGTKFRTSNSETDALTTIDFIDMMWALEPTGPSPATAR